MAIFDCDGTLVDSQDSIVSAMKTTFRQRGLDVPDGASIRRIIGLPLDESIKLLGQQISSDEAIIIAEEYKAIFRTMRREGAVHEPLFPNVCQALGMLDQDGWTLGIATGKASHGLVATLEPHGILDYFVTQQTSDVAKGKPDPDMVLKAMKETHAPPETTVMIGDTTFDMEMAKNAGVKSVGVSWGYHHPDELYSAGAEIVVDGLKDFSEVLMAVAEN